MNFTSGILQVRLECDKFKFGSAPPPIDAQPFSVGRFHFQIPHGTRGSRAFCVCQGVVRTGVRGGWFDPFLPSVLWKSPPTFSP